MTLLVGLEVSQYYVAGYLSGLGLYLENSESDFGTVCPDSSRGVSRPS